MNNLPNNGDSSTQKTTITPSIGSFGKEQEHSPIGAAESQVKDLGKEMDLPKEVVAAGVRARPTTVTIPPPVQNLGVKVTGVQSPIHSATTVVLPLSDVQIAEGLHTNITNSFRWLAEWCRYKLKKLGLIQ
ncbi:MAG: hypothetical protein WAV51_04305 [Microgenomates group bacterium]